VVLSEQRDLYGAARTGKPLGAIRILPQFPTREKRACRDYARSLGYSEFMKVECKAIKARKLGFIWCGFRIEQGETKA
jgi:hypothetical protein